MAVFQCVLIQQHFQVEQQFQKLMQSPLRNTFRLDSSNDNPSFLDEAASPLASVSRSILLEIKGRCQLADQLLVLNVGRVAWICC
jgi:hypothetical protein